MAGMCLCVGGGVCVVVEWVVGGEGLWVVVCGGGVGVVLWVGLGV